MSRAHRVGDHVRIERDETRYRPKGTWPRFRGRVGTVVEINRDRRRPDRTEYGVVFTKTRPRPDRPGQLAHGGVVTWFKGYELAQIRGEASQSHAEDATAALGCDCPPTPVGGM